MVVLERRINNRIGLHLRAAGEFVKVASQFESDINVIYGDQRANGKSILGLASLAAGHGAEVVVEIDGDDEGDAKAALAELFDQNFYED